MNNKIVHYKFKAFGKKYHLELETKQLDHEEDGEDYCYWIEEYDGHIFEVVLFKDGNGRYKPEGAVSAAVDQKAYKAKRFKTIKAQIKFEE